MYRIRTTLNTRLPADAGSWVLIAMLIILGGMMLFHGGFQVKSDGSNYFAYLRSAVFDRDLDFHNEFSHFDKAFWDTYKPKETVTGHLTNLFSVGPAILWAPFYLLAHLFVLIANLCGAGIIPNGFSKPYLLAVNVASLFYSFFGMYLIYQLSREYCRRWAALTATIALWLGSFITYYTVYQPYMSHAASFFSATLFIYYWHRTRPARSLRQWMLLGLAAGLMMLARWQNGLIMIFPAVESLVLYASSIKKRDWSAVLPLLHKNIVFLVFTAIGFLPQMIAWKIIYDSFLLVPQGTGFFRWSEPFLSGVLFSSRHGLYSWTPVLYPATIGWLAAFWKRDRLFAVSGLAAFLVMTYMNSVISDWWAGWGFGMRRFDGFILLFALGLAVGLDSLARISAKAAVALAISAALFFSAFNWFLMDQLNKGRIHPGGPVAFNKVLGISDTGIYKYTGYPFSFPANVIFSIRYKLPPARYDTLVGGYVDDPHFYGNVIRPAWEPALLGSGWSVPAVDNMHSVRTFQKKAVIYAPVRTVTDFEMTVCGAFIQNPPANILIYLNGYRITAINPLPAWSEFKLKLPGEHLKTGINILTFINTGTGTFAVESVKFTRLGFVPDWK